jgi:adenine phosphoribosyltransferase
LFADIFPIFRDPAATDAVVSHLTSHISSTHDLAKISGLVCLESRGFFFAPIIAARLGLPCIPVRKGGKLPGDKVTVSYQREYGPDNFEMKTDAFEGIETAGKKVILVDDLLGHGGSILAAKQLVEKLGAEVAGCVFIFDIPDYYETNKKNLGDMPWYAMVHLTEESLAESKK